MSQRTVALLISDQRMPDMLGTELLSQVKHLHPETIRMVITAFSDLDPILRAVNDGLVARYIVKPWDHEELERILAWGLEAYRLGQERSELQLRLLENERLATLGTLAAGVAHDLRNPITALLYNAERLTQFEQAALRLKDWLSTAPHVAEQDKTGWSELASELPEISSDMLASAKTMNDMVVSISRMVRREADNAVTPCEPVAVIRFALSLVKSVARENRARLVYDGPASLGRVRISQAALTQILVNLLSNAAQALGRKEPSGGTASVNVSEQPDQTVFSIADDGPGMQQDILAKLGTPFFTQREGGTGLGVNQCQRLISAAGGKFLVASTRGAGTTITFTVPRAPER
jgi:signal transduction histidine kinase